jgi:hypothetical protein
VFAGYLDVRNSQNTRVLSGLYHVLSIKELNGDCEFSGLTLPISPTGMSHSPIIVLGVKVHPGISETELQRLTMYVCTN